MRWHPIDQATRVGIDELLLRDEWMGPWAIIRRLQFEGETWYRAVTPEPDPAARRLVGYSTDLRTLAKHAYRAFLHRRNSTNGPINGWKAQGR